MKRLENKTAIITGAASGIGFATAKLFIEEGARVLLTDIQADAVKESAKKLGSNAIAHHHDVTSPEGWEGVMQTANDRWGKLDILVNNAGILMFAALEDFTPEQISKILNVNLFGTIIGTQSAARLMKQTNSGGSIVNISSADGLAGAYAIAPYAASKWGVRGFTKAAALELGPKNIRVNTVHPGGVDTPMTNPMSAPRQMFNKGFVNFAAGRAADPDEIAKAVLFLASDDSTYCMGAELAVDGGLTAGHYYPTLPGAPNR